MGVSFFMAKYSYEFKMKVVLEFLNKSGSYEFLAQKYNIPSATRIKVWVAAYRKHGKSALRRSRQNKNYPFPFKLQAVKLYLSTNLSYQDAALSLGMTEPSLLAAWVGRYRAVGVDGLKPQRKGRRKNVPKPSTGKEKEYVEQLEAENLRLRIENAYLKELRRLRLAEKAQKEKQGSSTVSEDHSN